MGHGRCAGSFRRGIIVVAGKDEEGYYIASVSAFPGGHTQARSLDELERRIREAIELCLEVERFTDSIWSSLAFNPSSLRHDPKSAGVDRRTLRL
jgi:predicted RNase H-like HicB family nuclease